MSVFLILIILVITASAQTTYWPEVLQAPLEEVPSDSNRISIVFSQNLLLNSYKTNNSFHILKNDSSKQLSQLCSYDLSNDHSLGIQNHYLDLSGSISKKKYPFKFSSIGLEWVPTILLNRNRGKSNAIGSMRLGPVISLDYLNLPIRFRGGGAADIWNNELPYTPGLDDLKNAEGDPGFYTGLNIGNNKKTLLEGIPLYAEGNIFGRYMNNSINSKITSGVVDALFLNELVFADTFFIYCADTLTKGRTAFLLEQAGGSSKYSSTPNRTMHSLQAACGFKNIGELFIKPSIAYNLALSSVTYPTNGNIIGDEKLVSNTISIDAHNDSSNFLNYNGGILFNFENEDWMFKSDIPNYLSENNRDSLIENLKDYKVFSTGMYHILGKRFKNNLAFTYLFNIDRYQKKYPSFYVVDNDTSRINEDKDDLLFKHRLDVTLLSFPKMNLSAIGEYIRNNINYLKKEMSAYNIIERNYRLETSLNINPDSSIHIIETIGARVRNEEYIFPALYTIGPPWSRKFYSRFSVTWNMNNNWQLFGAWNEIYSDYGNWSHVGYNQVENDYYAIESKSIETGIEVNIFTQLTNNLFLRIGNLYKHIYYIDWDDFYQEYSNRSNYYLLPFLEINVKPFKHTYFSATLKRYIDSDASDYWEGVSNIFMEF